MKLFTSIWRSLPKTWRARLSKPIDQFRDDRKWRKKKITNGGGDSDKVFYVIRYRFVGGLFGIMQHYLQEIQFALSKGYIPIIDMQNYKNMYLSSHLLGRENAWEYYFNQPTAYSLKDILDAKNVILGFGGKKSTKRKNNSRWIFDNKKMKKLHTIFSQYVTLNRKTSDYIQQEYKRLFSENETVLGVLCRGTDYTHNKPSAHPVQPTPELVIKKIDELLIEKPFDKIFLATEDKSIWDTFTARYGNRIITNKHEFYEDTGSNFLADISFDRENDAYLRGLEYLTTIMLLARCKYFIAGNCGGSQAAMYITEGFSYSYIFDLGVYE